MRSISCSPHRRAADDDAFQRRHVTALGVEMFDQALPHGGHTGGDRDAFVR